MLSLTVDSRLQEAHNESVKEVLIYINDNYAKTNAYDEDGNRTLNKGSGLLIATAKHSIARDEDKGVEDPHLHTHSLVFNITKDTTNNKFKALAANDMLRDANKFQEMYRSSLALKVKELGYQIEKHNAQSSAWDIAGIDRENVLHFSQRHNKIVANATTIQEQEHVQHKGKKEKSELTKIELLQSWHKQQTENFGMGFNELKEHCLNNVEKTQNLYESPKEV
jgi:conjugative relaxase-like TrwC/TraI family protein